MSEKTQISIKKPWAVYGLITKFIGRVVDDFRYGVDIRYSEGQLFATQLWSSKAVERFETSGEAIDYVLSVNHDYSRKELTQKVFEDFPKVIRKESIQRIHDILINYLQQNSCSQSSPKYTKRKSKKLKQLEQVEDVGYPDGYDFV